MRLFKNGFWHTLSSWQDQRAIWLLGGVTALLLDIFSFLYFQKHLRLNPCEMCVYIRFSMIAIFIGAMIAAINPRILLLKLVGYIVVTWAILRGILWSIHLDKMFWQSEALQNGADPFAIGVTSCSMFPTFPFHLPLDRWFPTVFQPQGICGVDTWRFFGFNMAELMFVVYGAFSVIAALMFTSFLIQHIKRRFSL